MEHSASTNQPVASPMPGKDEQGDSETTRLGNNNTESESAPGKGKSRLKRHKFKFYGNTKEFFGIWIVNLLLTILTLGVYSAWAKVRQTRYIYENLELDKTRFQYLAKPIAILRGRLIALLLVSPYIYFSYINPQVAGIIFVGILFFAPVLIVMALRFRMHNTAYRNIRFRFTASMWKAYVYYGLLFFVGIITLGLAMPAVIKAQKQFRYNHTAWGLHHFETKASYWFFYFLVIRALVVAIIVGVLIGFFTGMFSGALGEHAALLSFLPGLLIYVFVLHYCQTAVLQHMLESTEIAGACFETFQIEPAEYAKIQATNLLAIIGTLGLAYPWAKIRATEYLVSNICLITREGLEHAVKMDGSEQSALSDEIAGMYELELGL